MSDSDGTFMQILVGSTLVAALFVGLVVWGRSRHEEALRDCTARGGHLEAVIGGRGGEVCVGGRAP